MHSGDAAVLFYARLEIHQDRMAAAVTVEDLFARQADFYGTVEQERGFRDDDFVIEGIAFAAEAAAVRRGDNPNVRGRHLQDFGESAMEIVGSLRAGPDSEFAVGIFGSDGGVLLDGQMRAALIEKSVFEDFVGFGEALIDVAELQRDALVDVAFIAVVVDAGSRSGESFFGVGDRGEEFVVDLDQVEGLEGDQFFASDYRGNRVADMTDMVEAKGLLILADRQNAVFDGEIFADEDEVDTGVSGGARDVDAANAGVRVRGAQEFAVRHTRKGNVISEARLTGNFRARVYASARPADYAEISLVSVGFCLWRICWLRHRRS